MELHARIARRAIANLGRRARAGKFVDWSMAYAIRDAAKAEGLDDVDRLAQWVNPRARTATDYAAGLVARYVQAFGPVGHLIDAGAHLGTRTPVIVSVA
jgi:hypothetical protein